MDKKILQNKLNNVIDWDSVKWRALGEGEEIKDGDYSDSCNNGYKDAPKWEKLVGVSGGNFAPARYPAHRQYRRLL